MVFKQKKKKKHLLLFYKINHLKLMNMSKSIYFDVKIVYKNMFGLWIPTINFIFKKKFINELCKKSMKRIL